MREKYENGLITFWKPAAILMVRAILRWSIWFMRLVLPYTVAIKKCLTARMIRSIIRYLCMQAVKVIMLLNVCVPSGSRNKITYSVFIANNLVLHILYPYFLLRGRKQAPFCSTNSVSVGDIRVQLFTLVTPSPYLLTGAENRDTIKETTFLRQQTTRKTNYGSRTAQKIRQCAPRRNRESGRHD